MKRTSLSGMPCSVARTMDLLGDWWTPLVLREAFYGICRFDDFARELGLARTTLTKRLVVLVDAGLLEKVAYQHSPVRHEYLLTEMGRDFYPVLAAITTWGDRWLAGSAGAPIELHHTSCGHTVSAAVVCSHCGEPLTADGVQSRMGPGYPSRLARRADVRERFARQLT